MKSTGAIFNEMDDLANKIFSKAVKSSCNVYGVKAEMVRDEIGAVLDQWVKDRIVRFNAQIEAYEHPPGCGRQFSTDEMSLKFLDLCGRDILEMCGIRDSHVDGDDITLYVMAFKENF